MLICKFVRVQHAQVDCEALFRDTVQPVQALPDALDYTVTYRRSCNHPQAQPIRHHKHKLCDELCRQKHQTILHSYCSCTGGTAQMQCQVSSGSSTVEIESLGKPSASGVGCMQNLHSAAGPLTHPMRHQTAPMATTSTTPQSTSTGTAETTNCRLWMHINTLHALHVAANCRQYANDLNAPNAQPPHGAPD
jgi:hypothetical protein